MSEVKRYKAAVISVSSWCGHDVVLASDHDRVVAERDADIAMYRERADSATARNAQLIAEREALAADKARLLAECDEMRQRQLWVESLIASFVVPHEALDDEATPGDQYDELMASWTLALTELRAYYHDHIDGGR